MNCCLEPAPVVLPIWINIPKALWEPRNDERLVHCKTGHRATDQSGTAENQELVVSLLKALWMPEAVGLPFNWMQTVGQLLNGGWTVA